MEPLQEDEPHLDDALDQLEISDEEGVPEENSLHQRMPRRSTQRRSGLLGLTVPIKTTTSSYLRQTSVDTTTTYDTTTNNFIVRSIRRGTGEWHELLKPFCADLAFFSVQSQHFQRQHPQFRPFTTTAVVLFVDISGYSKIASALASRGAHALSTSVNDYLSRILRLVRQYGGDVVKFAGDAVLCLWYSRESNDENLQANVLAASLCATQLQQQAGRHEVKGTNLEFRIHAGMCLGTVESEIFVAPVHENMQRMFHLVGGEPLEEIGDLVDAAKAGQVCISGGIQKLLDKREDIQASYQAVLDFPGDEPEETPQLLLDLQVTPTAQAAVESFVEETMVDRVDLRDRIMEEDFIHPAVVDLLSHGGSSPTQIAQMRDLVVLFIAQTSHGSPKNWLIEVQGILDRNQCPLLQVVADDKGVHAIAAVNAVAAVPDSRLVGLEICRQLVAQQIGVAIGVAAGSTFCGVTGSSSVACRWDITGGPPVRAARLMQYALKKNVSMALDESLMGGNTVPARMTLLEADVPIKGSPGPIKVFTLSEATEFAAMNILESVHGEMHNDQVDLITEHITGQRSRSAIVVTGPTLSGKKIVCQRAAGYANMVPFLHVSDSSYGLLQLARTVANWFKYNENAKVQEKAKSVLEFMNKGLFSRAHDECLELVDEAMEARLVACFVVDRVEFLDDFSISFIRECLHGRKYRKALQNAPSTIKHRPPLVDSVAAYSFRGGSGGRIAFLCVHVPFYNSPTASSVAEDITRNHVNLSVPVVEVLEATRAQFIEMSASMTGVTFDERLVYTATAAAGHCAGYFVERSAAIGGMQPERVKNGLKPMVALSEDLKYEIPPGMLREYRHMSVMKIGSEIAMRFAHVYDELPPIMQVFCKTLGVVSQTGFYWATRQRVWEVLNDLIAEGVDDDSMSILLREMSELYLIRLWTDVDGVEYVKFQSPALADIAMDVCTPEQLEHIAKAWNGRLAPEKKEQFRVPLVLAWLHVMINPHRTCSRRVSRSEKLWREGYIAIQEASKREKWTLAKLDRWKELLACEIEAGGSKVSEVLGPNFGYGAKPFKPVDFAFLRVWLYRGPIGLGPLGNTMSVIGQLIKEAMPGYQDDSLREKGSRYMTNAVRRYKKEVEIMEELLSVNNLGQDRDEVDAEFSLLDEIAVPSSNTEQVYKKAEVFLDQVIPRFVIKRLDRLRSLTECLDGKEVPTFVSNCQCECVGLAYNVMFRKWICKTQANQVDCAQHALMILATRGWVPRPTPEPLRHLLHQTVARLRNAVVRKLSAGQMHYQQHQQSAVDLKEFLVSTALLFDAQDSGKYTP